MDGLCARKCYASAYMHTSYILVCEIESLETREVVVMVLRILGSKGSHKISGDQLHIVEHVLRGTYFGWAQMFLTQIQRGMGHASSLGGDFE